MQPGGDGTASCVGLINSCPTYINTSGPFGLSNLRYVTSCYSWHRRL